MRLGVASLLLHCLSAAVYPLITSLLYPRVGIVGDLFLSGINSQHQAGRLRGMPTYRLPAFWYAR